GKRALRGSTPKDPEIWHSGREDFAPRRGARDGIRPPFSFRLAEKKTGRGRSKRKGRFFLTNEENPGHATGPSAAFALVVALPSLSALPASLRAGAVDSEPLASAAAGAV